MAKLTRSRVGPPSGLDPAAPAVAPSPPAIQKHASVFISTTPCEPGEGIDLGAVLGGAEANGGGVLNAAEGGGHFGVVETVGEGVGGEEGGGD
ncbi:hypothetical protein Tsubulata_018208 [Turnera subulata]|uniref:Uncharacterized protein n=1 Tax=Turnera subulata TaxID=218843 RepID=A0A9Q0FAC5_9ROSI|nr:hypothetical protein Tsubulata_018208 [Turnera subulata]